MFKKSFVLLFSALVVTGCSTSYYDGRTTPRHGVYDDYRHNRPEPSKYSPFKGWMSAADKKAEDKSIRHDAPYGAWHR